MTFVGTILTYIPMHLAGLGGMPRRIVDYAEEFTDLNVLASIGGFLLGVSVLPFIYNMVVSWAKGPVAGDNPWGALTLEWMTSSPPPAHNFEEAPVLTHGPYDYGQGLDEATPAAAPAGGD